MTWQIDTSPGLQTCATKTVIGYARYVAGSSERESQTRPAIIAELADADDPEAMVVIGNLYAKGVEVNVGAQGYALVQESRRPGAIRSRECSHC